PHVSGEAEPTRIAGVRRDLALPQRQRNPVILDKGAGWPQASNVARFAQPSSGPPACRGHEEEGTTSEGRSSQGETVPPRRPKRPPRCPPTRGSETPVTSRPRLYLPPWIRLGTERQRDPNALRLRFPDEDHSASTHRVRASATHRGVPIRETTCGSVQDAWRMCLGNLKSIAEGRGDSVRPDHSPVSSPDVRLSALVEAAPSKVFDAFAIPGHVAHWTTGGVPRQEARVEPRPGGAFSFESVAEPDRVVEWVPNQRVVLQRSLEPDRRI